VSIKLIVVVVILERKCVLCCSDVCNEEQGASFEVSTAVQLKTLFLWDMMPCHWAVSSHHFETMQWHLLQELECLIFEEESSDYPVTQLPIPEEDSALEQSGFCL